MLRMTAPAQPAAPPDWQRAADPRRRVGRRIEVYAEIGSTNDRARAALRAGEGDGLAVVAELQTSGRGRRGRLWSSPPGVNLMVSVALAPGLPGSLAGQLGMAVALATQRALAAAAPGAGIGVRWPNDIVERDGLKLAGLLIETAVEGATLAEAVIGIGINVNWRRDEMPPEIAARATSLAELTGREHDRVDLLERLLTALEEELESIGRGESPADRLRGVFALGGRRVEVDTGEVILDGTVADIGDDGALLLDTAEGRVALSIGEVVVVRDPSPVTA
jgi:BirA family transcriptional regulator, biotin operon repressor / biotin---[acetyl-CoA-carboxylase] ligase